MQQQKFLLCQFQAVLFWLCVHTRSSLNGICVRTACLLFWCEGLDNRQSCCLSPKSRNNQQPQREAAFSAPRSIPSILTTRVCTRTHKPPQTYCKCVLAHTHTHVGKYAHHILSPDISCIFIKTNNSLESLKTSHVWTHKHRPTLSFVSLFFFFWTSSSKKD